MPNTDPTTIDPTTIVLLAIVYAVVLFGGYVWLSLALSRVFPKLGEEGWKAWVPVLREMTVFQLGGFSSAWVVALFLPFINIIGLVVTVMAVHQINKQLGRSAVFTVLAVVAYPVWATIVGFGSNDRAPRPVVSRPTGYQPFAELPQSGSGAGPVAGPVAGPPASAAPARTFGEGSPFNFEPAAPVPPAAPPAPPAARPAPLAITVATPFSAAGPPPPPSPAGGQISFQPIPQPARAAAPPVPPVPPTPSAPPAAPEPGAPPALIDPAADAWSAPAPQVRPAPESMPLFLEAAVAPAAPAPAVAPVPVARPVATPAPTPPPAPITPPPAAFPTLPTAAVAPATETEADAALPATPVNAVPDTEHTVIPVPAPAGADLDDDDFEDTVIVNRREELWVLSPEGAEPVRVTRPVALLGRNPSPSPEHPDAQLIRLTDPARTVSKTHARIELVSGAWMIIDLASTNGVYLRGDDGADVELEANLPTTLTPGFRLGELAFRLERED